MLTGPAKCAHFNEDHWLVVVADVELNGHIFMAVPQKRLPDKDYWFTLEIDAKQCAYMLLKSYMSATKDPLNIPPYEKLEWVDCDVPIWAPQHLHTIRTT